MRAEDSGFSLLLILVGTKIKFEVAENELKMSN
jgi:hypothetical protein